MPDELVADEMGPSNTVTLVAATIICKLLTEKVVMGWQQLILWGNIIDEWEKMAHNDFPGIINEEREWYS
jgi:hypothetical protein